MASRQVFKVVGVLLLTVAVSAVVLLTPPAHVSRGGRLLRAAGAGAAIPIDTLDPHISIVGGPTYFPRVYKTPLSESPVNPAVLYFDLASLVLEDTAGLSPGLPSSSER